ncbi:MAG: LacI family DNA-binding transcriptional regulator [Angustibacter sp.]
MIELTPDTARATLNEVAARAGVSRATAGRVLAGSHRVSKHRSRAVRQAASDLGYVTNRAARALVTGRSDAIAMVISENSDRMFGEPFFAGLIRGARDTAAALDVQLVLVMVSSPADRENFLRFAIGGALDGVILASLHGNDPLPRQLREAGLTVVVAGRPYCKSLALPRVDADNVAGGRLAARALLTAGATRPAIINGPLDMPPARDRLRGWALEMADSGRLPGPSITADFTYASGYRAIGQLLRKKPNIDGVFCASDQIALGVLQYLRDSGIRCPEDIRVVGFDDIPPAASSRPTLTTIRQPMEQLGQELARMTISLSRQEACSTEVILATSVIHRGSC